MRGTVAVVGGGIAGLAAAHRLATGGTGVVLFERSARVGGKIDGGPFAGVEHVDTGADAFLARVPDGMALAADVGLGGALIHPERVGAAVWHDGLHRIPEGLVLGVPGRLGPLARTGLLSWRGKARAGLDLVLPRTRTDGDSIGAYVRARLGDEVHERLVDALVGSIYAADTDRFSLAEVPQLAALAGRGRSLLLSGRRTLDTAGTAAAAVESPIFAAPQHGMSELCAATASAAVSAGATILTSADVHGLAPTADGRWRVDGPATDGGDGTVVDAVVLACPPAAAGRLLAEAAPDATELLRRAETADVVMVTLHVPAGDWPDRLRGMSGYLVPKPDQRAVTAASFGSQKWAHWAPPGGGEILRVSLGRDGMPVLDLDDATVVDRTLADLRRHLGVDLAPTEIRITRWPAAFAQYRPHHRQWVGAVERALPAGVFVAGAGYRGIGVPACIRDGRLTAERAEQHVAGLG